MVFLDVEYNQQIYALKENCLRLYKWQFFGHLHFVD